MKKLLIIFPIFIFVGISYGQNITYEDLKSGICNIDKFMETLDKKNFTLSETSKLPDNTTYTFAKNVGSAGAIVVQVTKYLNGVSVIEITMNYELESSFNVLKSKIEINCSKIKLGYDEFCDCFINHYQCGKINFRFYKKFDGKISYHFHIQI